VLQGSRPLGVVRGGREALLTVRDVAAQLGVCGATVYRLVADGKIAARVFYLFDHGRELREVGQEAEVPPSVVRELWHEWLTDLEEGEMERRKTAQSERRRRQEQEEMRAVEWQSEREQKNFETMMAGLTAAMSGKDKG